MICQTVNIFKRVRVAFLRAHYIRTQLTVILHVCTSFGLLKYNFIITTITISKKDIGILRSLGARNIDVFKIFVSESMILTILSYILGIMLFIASLEIINNRFLFSHFNELDIIKVEFVYLLFSLVFSVVMSLLLSILSINRVTRIKPIDAILDK